MKYNKIITIAFKINTICWLFAAWLFAPIYWAARLSGVINHPHDVLVCGVVQIFLMTGCVMTLFLNFGKGEK